MSLRTVLVGTSIVTLPVLVDSSAPPTIIYYFGDDSPDTHAHVDPDAIQTGPNGQVLPLSDVPTARRQPAARPLHLRATLR